MAVVLPGAMPAAAQAPSDSLAWSRAHADALHALQGVPGSIALAPEDVEATARALLAIREALPQLRDIRPASDDTYLILVLTDESAAHITLTGGDSDVEVRTQVGLPRLDSLNRALGVDSVQIVKVFGGLAYLRPFFPFPPNAPVLGERYLALPEVQVAGAGFWNDVGGSTGDYIEHFRKGDLWQFVFVRARGDCPAGCTEYDYYYVTWDPEEERVVLADTYLDGEERPDDVHLWGMPPAITAAPFATHEALLVRLEDPRWWARRHAAEVTGLLLARNEQLWRQAEGEDFRPVYAAWPRTDDDERIDHDRLKELMARHDATRRLERLEHDVDAHRLEMMLALADRVADEDGDVRDAAHMALRRLSGVDPGVGEEARAHWRAWAAGGGWRAPLPAYVEKDTCEGELCAKVDGLHMLEPTDVRADPSLEAPVAFRAERGEEVDLLATDLHHVWTGRVILRDSVRVEDPSRGPPLTLMRRDTVQVLGYRGEGVYGILWRGEVRDTRAFWPLPFDSGPRDWRGFFDRAAHTHTWHRIRTKDGREGWVLYDPLAMEVVGPF